MRLIDYINSTGLIDKPQSLKAVYLMYFLYKEREITVFSSSVVNEIFSDAGFSKPNYSRLRQDLIKQKLVRACNKKDTTFEYVPIYKQRLDVELSGLWEDNSIIISNSELIDEEKFCDIRGFITKLIKQINFSYANNCYDACAILMRRLFEVLLILSYENLGIDSEIKRDSNYVMLKDIVNNAISNTTLKLSRNKNSYHDIREVGNNSAHSITYNATLKDINDIKNDYRLMLDELFNKAGLIE